MNKFIKSKANNSLGYRTPDFFKGKTFKGKGVAAQKANTPQFKTQHKGS